MPPCMEITWLRNATATTREARKHPGTGIVAHPYLTRLAVSPDRSPFTLQCEQASLGTAGGFFCGARVESKILGGSEPEEL